MSGLLNLKRGVAEVGDLKGVVAGATITVGAEDSGSIDVAIQLLAWNGGNLDFSAGVVAYLSDNADGSTVAGTAPDTVAIGTDGLAIPLVAGKTFLLVSESDGAVDLSISEDGADTWYLVVVLPGGALVISSAITFAA